MSSREVLGKSTVNRDFLGNGHKRSQSSSFMVAFSLLGLFSAINISSWPKLPDLVDSYPFAASIKGVHSYVQEKVRDFRDSHQTLYQEHLDHVAQVREQWRNG
jgi:hypothetical protein